MKVTDCCGLEKQLVDNLLSNNVQSFFDIQQQIIPMMLNFGVSDCVLPRDICVSAPTGSGKTLSYAVPIVNAILKRNVSGLFALIVLPSRELAIQVFGVISRLIDNTNITALCLSGNMQTKDEKFMLFGGTDRILVNILICTPGKLLEHVQQTTGFALSSLRFLVLDEADRLLGNAYHFWVKSLIDSANVNEKESLKRKYDEISCPRIPLQKLLFSATLTDNPRKLEMLGIRNPIIYRLNTFQRKTTGEEGSAGAGVSAVASAMYSLPTTLSESIRVCDTQEKPVILVSILAEAFGIHQLLTNSTLKFDPNDINRQHIHCCSQLLDMCLIFTSSVEATHRLCLLLQLINGQHPELLELSEASKDTVTDPESTAKSSLLFDGNVEEMSRDLKTTERESIMERARSGQIKILVSSDAMARGIDLSNIRMVINYDLMKHPRTYVHRVGRTARAGLQGHAITLLKKGQNTLFDQLRQSIGGGKIATVEVTESTSTKVSLPRCKILTSTIDDLTQHCEAALQKLPLLLSE